mmetsp:Transcript_15764/g.32317  ORF Transcript_15764/g.32317 Transcript_15764/m.32317 type:complete len:174 (-) Transcript_15764:60-581(-)
MPFVKNSTATSGLPPDARRQALTSASRNPIVVRLFTTSAGNSSSPPAPSPPPPGGRDGAGGAAAGGAEGAGVSDAAAGAGAAGAGAGVASIGSGAEPEEDAAEEGAGVAGGFDSAVVDAAGGASELYLRCRGGGRCASVSLFLPQSGAEEGEQEREGGEPHGRCRSCVPRRCD